MMNLADQANLSELVLKAGPDGKTYLGPPGDAGTADDRDRPRTSTPTRSPRIWVDPDNAARYGTSVYERCGQKKEYAPIQRLDHGADMNLRMAFLARAAAATIAAAAAFLPGVLAIAEQVDMNVVDQPGYVPTPEEQELSGPTSGRKCSSARPSPPGTIIIDTNQRFLYLVQPDNRALRYGIGVGRDGFQW